MDDDLKYVINTKMCEGLVIDNYKQLCEMLNIPVYSGNQKIKQLGDLAEYMLWEKDGVKFVIIKLFTNQLLPERFQVKEQDFYESGVFIAYLSERVIIDYCDNFLMYYVHKKNNVPFFQYCSFEIIKKCNKNQSRQIIQEYRDKYLRSGFIVG